MTIKKRRLLDYLESGGEFERRGNVGMLLNHTFVHVEITPHAAQFMIWLLEQPCSATPLRNSIKKATLAFDPSDKNEEHRRAFEENYVVPDPIGTLKAVKTMQTLRLSCDHVQALSWALSVTPALVAQELLGMPEEAATTSKVLSKGGPIDLLMSYYFPDDEFFYEVDTQIVFAQLLRISMLMLEIDISAAHAAAAFQQLGTMKPNIMGGPGRLLRVGRNHPCPCGSGRKYKKCHKKKREG